MSEPSTEFFQLFDLPISFDIDKTQLSVKYQALQTQYHPDRYASEDAKTRRVAVENAALINQAHDTLKDPLKRGFYLLKLADVNGREVHHTIKDGAFLMQQMEYRERLDEVEEKDDPLAAVDFVRADLSREENQLVETFKSSYDSGSFEVALDNLTKLQFFGRLKNQLSEMEAELEDKLFG